MWVFEEKPSFVSASKQRPQVSKHFEIRRKHSRLKQKPRKFLISNVVYGAKPWQGNIEQFINYQYFPIKIFHSVSYTYRWWTRDDLAPPEIKLYQWGIFFRKSQHPKLAYWIWSWLKVSVKAQPVYSLPDQHMMANTKNCTKLNLESRK